MSNRASGLLSGSPKNMLSTALEIQKEVDLVVDTSEAIFGDGPEEKEEDEDEIAIKALKVLLNSVKSVAWGFAQKAVDLVGAEAIDQVTGPIGWINKLSKIFGKMAEGGTWVCERIVAAIKRANPRLSV